MKLSIFIPSHDSRNLDRAVNSVLSQSAFHSSAGIEIEVIVLLNGTALQGTPWKHPDPSVAVHRAEDIGPVIGALKRRACGLCTGDVFIELDHDDELLPGCLMWIAGVMDGHAARPIFAFSPTEEVDGHDNAKIYGRPFGWEHGAHGGRVFNKPFPITARSLCEIFYAPNHVRAWNRIAYETAGGHDEALECGDDHDLMCRTYLAGAQFICAEIPLYRQHFHTANSQHGERNARIQKQQALNRDKYLTPLVMEWCKRESFAMLDLGGAFNCPAGFIPIDVIPCGGIEWDIENMGLPPLAGINEVMRASYAGVGCIRAKDFLEHIHPTRVVETMNAIHAALVPGGWLLSLTPSTDGRGAWQDPTHVSFWNQNSFLYYTSQHQAKYVPAIKARFQAAAPVATFFPGDWERQNDIPYVQANLCALHGQRQPGLIGFPR